MFINKSLSISQNAPKGDPARKQSNNHYPKYDKSSSHRHIQKVPYDN